MCKCCLTVWNHCFWSECSKRLEAGQGRSERTTWASYVNWTLLRTTARGTESVHWYSRIWPTDNRDVTEVKTALPLRIVPQLKSQGFSRSTPPSLLYGCHGEQISPAAICHTHVGTFSLSSSLSFLSLTFYHAASPRGLPKRAFCPLTMPGVSRTSPYIYSAKREQLLKMNEKSFPFSSSLAYWYTVFPLCCGSVWVFCIHGHVRSDGECAL